MQRSVLQPPELPTLCTPGSSGPAPAHPGLPPHPTPRQPTPHTAGSADAGAGIDWCQRDTGRNLSASLGLRALEKLKLVFDFFSEATEGNSA